MATVYVTFDSGKVLDFSQAETFGRIQFLTREDLVNIKSSEHNDYVLRDIRAKLIKYDPAVDWLVLTPSPYINAAIMLMLGNRHMRSVRILRWDSRNARYIPLYLDLPKEI